MGYTMTLKKDACSQDQFLFANVQRPIGTHFLGTVRKCMDKYIILWSIGR